MGETNARWRCRLDGLAPDPARPDPPLQSVASPQQMAGLLSEMMSAGQWLRALPDKDALLVKEVSEYRKNVERPRAALPSMHGARLREAARLEQERGRVE